MNSAAFKLRLIEFILGLFRPWDEKVKGLEADKAALIKVVESKDARIAQLEGQLEAANVAIAEDEAKDAAELNQVFEDIKAQFSPSESNTPVTDSVIVAVQESPDVQTPPLVVQDNTAGTAIETPEPVAQAAVIAIVDTAMEVSEMEAEEDS